MELFAFPNDSLGDSYYEPTLENAVPCAGTESFEELLDLWVPHFFEVDLVGCFETEEELRKDIEGGVAEFLVFTKAQLAIAEAVFPDGGYGNDTALYAGMAGMKRVLAKVAQCVVLQG